LKWKLLEEKEKWGGLIVRILAYSEKPKEEGEASLHIACKKTCAGNLRKSVSVHG
jgi:hypothetical protein